ncbi:MAG: fumarylacetoacetate hydrolase family protein [Hyphomonadaceae bacterium]
MSAFVFPAPDFPSVAVRGGGRYPVRRIFCVGRNYAEHAREMGGNDREPPFFFTKATDSLAPSGATIAYPPGTANLHHEMELVLALGADAFEIEAADARDAIWGYACGLDMTRRDLQNASREKKQPWDLGKSFEESAVLSEIAPASAIGHPRAGAITLAVNFVEKQRGDLSDMIWSPEEIVAALSRFYHLRAGDLIFTGTPSGVGPVVRGDALAGAVAGVGDLAVTYGT